MLRTTKQSHRKIPLQGVKKEKKDKSAPIKGVWKMVRGRLTLVKE